MLSARVSARARNLGVARKIGCGILTWMEAHRASMEKQSSLLAKSRIHAHAASSSHRGDEESFSESTDLEDIDATSDGSDFGPQQFAEQVQKGKFTKFKPRYIPRKGTRK